MSSSIPSDVKKMPLKRARKGRTSDSAWSPYSDSEMMSPAMKAPIAMENPAAEVTRVAPMPKNPIHKVEELAITKEDDAIKCPLDDQSPPHYQQRHDREPADQPQSGSRQLRLAGVGQNRQ